MPGGVNTMAAAIRIAPDCFADSPLRGLAMTNGYEL